ncbi:MAG: hypothetical protein AAFW73_11570 [Bacteroidota bacterium]
MKNSKNKTIDAFGKHAVKLDQLRLMKGGQSDILITEAILT